MGARASMDMGSQNKSLSLSEIKTQPSNPKPATSLSYQNGTG